MIVGIGTDIIHLPRIARLLQRHGDRFAGKILHLDELRALQLMQQEARKVEFLAGRWAAKEAAFKAFPQTSPRLQFPDLSVQKKAIALHGNAALSANTLGIEVRSKNDCIAWPIMRPGGY